ncbi:MAG: NAD-dependent epimerase/dehydratase family protein, partial [Erysipelotrichaceae bacterium]
MNKLYIITGVSGNLGHTIANTLIMQKQRVRGLILPNQNISHISPKIELILGDITDKASLTPLFKDTEHYEVYVIHTA